MIEDVQMSKPKKYANKVRISKTGGIMKVKCQRN